MLAFLVVAFLALCLVAIVAPLPRFVAGIVVGMITVGGGAMLPWLLVTNDGSMNWRVGALGELDTSDRLRHLGRGWTILNSLRVPAADGTDVEVDHIAVGPGGVLVVETKLWPAKLRDLDVNYTDTGRAARQTWIRAGVVRRHLADIVPGDAVVPVVVFWGSDLASPADRVRATKEGVAVVHGRDFRTWLPAVADRTVLTADQIAVVQMRLSPWLVSTKPSAPTAEVMSRGTGVTRDLAAPAGR